MEATVVLIDNSEWTRSGDYAPTRYQAQADAVNLLAGAKTQANPENTVGVLTMAGPTPRVLVTPTPDLGKVLNCVMEARIDGDRADLAAAVQVAQLALKHRQNKHQRQRIVAFVGSPLRETAEALVKIGKKLKKNNVALDIVSFAGEDGVEGADGEGAGAGGSNGGASDGASAASNAEKLEALRAAADSGGNSHLVVVPPGPVLSDVLIGSAIFQGEGYDDGGGGGGGDGGGGGGGGGNFAEYGGIDPSLDPELALALRVSLEEERARQAAAAAAAGGEAGGEGAAAAGGEGGAGGATPAPAAAAAAAAGGGGGDDMDEDALLQQALAMSMQVDGGGGGAAEATPAPAAAAAGGSGAAAAAAEGGDDMDAEMAMALQMSMQEAQPPAAPSKKDKKDEGGK